jgi:hypothetical protein
MNVGRLQVVISLAALWILAAVVPQAGLTRADRHVAEEPAMWRPEHSGRTQSYPHERANVAEHLPSGLVLAAAVLSAVGLVAFLAWRLRRRKNDLFIYIEYPRQVWGAYLILGFLILMLAAICWVAWHESTRPVNPPVRQDVVDGPENREVPLPPVRSSSPRQADVPEASTWVRYIWVTFLVLLAAGIWDTLRRTPKDLPSEPGDLSPAIEETRQAVVTFQEPADPVARCYRDMCRVFEHRAKMTAEVTAREFALLLAKAGVGDPEVRSLTDLFEQVRYGGRMSGPREHGEAVALLETIESRYGRGFNEA